MAGMLRFKNEEEFRAAVGGRNIRRAQKQGFSGKTHENGNRINGDSAGAKSDIEELLVGQIAAVGNLPAPERQYPHIRGRKHTLDLAWPEWTVYGLRIGLEVQGMPHRIKEKFLADIEKRVLAQQQGWLVLEVAGEHIRNGKAMEWLQFLFKKARRISDGNSNY